MVDQVFQQRSVQHGAGFEFLARNGRPDDGEDSRTDHCSDSERVETEPAGVFLRRFSGRSASEMSWSMLLVRKSCGSNRHLPRATEENSTLRDHLAQPVLQAAPLRSRDLQVCVTLEKFFGSVILEAHRKPSILAF